MSESLPVVQESKGTIPLTEYYRDVLQGEGSTAGTPCSFIRLTACDLECTFCDSIHTWKPGHIVTSKKTPEEVAKFLKGGRARKLIITGGEPLLHQSKPYFAALINKLEESYRWDYEVETNGFHVPNGLLTDLSNEGRLQINCSPKLSNAGMGDLAEKYEKDGALPEIFARGGIFKFVVRDESDVLEALALLSRVFHTDVSADSGYPFRDKTWIMPEGQTIHEVTERFPLIYDLAIQFGLNLSHRLHVLRHDNKKAV
jgi:7-carboxy-7-deazaguanine synthase